MKLFLSDQLGYDENKTRLLCEFVLFCSEMLPIENQFEIHVVGFRKPHNITTTAAYEINNNCCKIYGKNRALVDIMRSIAHEMTHMMQDEMGLLVGHIQDAGGFHEDQANAKAGELIKLFVKSKEDRKAIYESSYNKIKNKKLLNSFKSYNMIKEGMSDITPKFGSQNTSFGEYESEAEQPKDLGSAISPDNSAVIKGDKFIVHGVEFQSEPAEGAGNIAIQLWQSAESAGQKSIKDLGLPKKNGVTQGWESTPTGRAWVSKHIYDASKPGSGAKYAPLLGTKNESHWSSWFFSVAYKGYDSEGGRGSNHYDYGADEGMKIREKVFKDPNSYKDKIVFMTFATNEAPLFKGDSVFAHRAEKAGAGFSGIGNPPGPAHMRTLTDDQGTVCGGNEGCKVGKGKVSLNDDKTLVAGQKYNGEVYSGVYKRVKVLGPVKEKENPDKEVKKESISYLDSYNVLKEGMGSLTPKFSGGKINFGDEGKAGEGGAGSVNTDFSSGGIEPNKDWPDPSPVFNDVSKMTASDQVINDIKKSEGFFTNVYDDLAKTAEKKAGLDKYENAKGTPTIGYGEAIFWKSNKAKADKYRPYLKGGKKMSESEATELLKATIKKHADIFKKDIKVPLTQNMFDALTSYCFNTGPGGLKKFGIIEPLNKKDYVTVAKIIQSKPTTAAGSGGKKLLGLIRRRNKEASIFSTGAKELSKELNELSSSGSSILIAGDSQIGGSLGQTLTKTLGVPVESRIYKNGAGGKEIAGLIKNKVGNAKDGIIISFGGNDGGEGVNDLISVVKESPVFKSNPKKIVFLGPPPAYSPTDFEYTKKVFGSKYNPGDFKNRYNKRKGYNQKIKSAVESANMTFISPYDYIGNETKGGKDGIHLNQELANKFVNSIKSKLPTASASNS